MDIFVKDLETGEVTQFPMAPNAVKTEAATRFMSYDIMKTGEVVIPLGEDLTGFRWSGLLPGPARRGEPYIRAWTDPQVMQSKFSIWRRYNRKLLLTVTGTPIMHAVYLENYDCESFGGYGDMEYSISFKVAKDIIVDPEGKETKSDGGGAKTTPPAAAQKKKTYAVRAGDSLYKIAQSQLGAGSRWGEIYNANKATIDGANKGKKVEWTTVYPGQVLTIPG